MLFWANLGLGMVNCSLNCCFDVWLVIFVGLSLCSLELGNLDASIF